MAASLSKCPSCDGSSLYVTEAIANDMHSGQNLLPGLGRLFRNARMDVVVCADCGLMRLFAQAEERGKLREDGSWRRLEAK